MRREREDGNKHLSDTPLNETSPLESNEYNKQNEMGIKAMLSKNIDGITAVW